MLPPRINKIKSFKDMMPSWAKRIPLYPKMSRILWIDARWLTFAVSGGLSAILVSQTLLKPDKDGKRLYYMDHRRLVFIREEPISITTKPEYIKTNK